MNVCLFYHRDRPAAIPVDVKSIDDTSNFDEFPEIDLKWRKYLKILHLFLGRSYKTFHKHIGT